MLSVCVFGKKSKSMKYILKMVSRLYHHILDKKRKRYIEDLKRKGLKLGKNVHIIEVFFFDPAHCFLISIGDNCTICPNVRLIAHDASTKSFLDYTRIGKIDIKENCFIGDSVTVLPNVYNRPKLNYRCRISRYQKHSI